jgi:methylated-DNA-protein-cysteine methyltransferase-like protein
VIDGEPRVVTEGFHERVCDVVRRVPAGRLTTYGDVAAALGSPRVARHVGWALAALREGDVPWHRVINAQGRISFKGDVVRGETQRRRLEAEGVAFDGADRAPLKALRWRFDTDQAAAVATKVGDL